jgi:hypothetical protein
MLIVLLLTSYPQKEVRFDGDRLPTRKPSLLASCIESPGAPSKQNWKDTNSHIVKTLPRFCGESQAMINVGA